VTVPEAVEATAEDIVTRGLEELVAGAGMVKCGTKGQSALA